METRIGRQLTQARESLGMIVEEVAHITRIPAAIIRQLENEEYSQFPNNVYAKSFLKLYCKFLKIDSSIYIEERGGQLIEHDSKVIFLDGVAVNEDFQDLEKEKVETTSPVSLAAAITLLLLGIPSIILINNQNEPKDEKIRAELYAPTKPNDLPSSKQESVAEAEYQGTSPLPKGRESSPETPIPKNIKDLETTPTAPKALPIDAILPSGQPVAISSRK